VEGKCKFCNGDHLIKDGYQPNSKQRWKCNDCSHKFVNPERPVKAYVDSRTIAIGLELYYEGLSLRKVSRMLKRLYGVKVSQMSIWKWIQKYTPLVKDFVQSLTPSSRRGMFHTDETYIPRKRPKEKEIWYWDCIDHDSRYIVGSHLSRGCCVAKPIKDAAKFFRYVKKQYKTHPNTVIVDGLLSYYKGLKRAFGGMTVKNKIDFTPNAGIAKEMPKNNLRIERYHNFLKARIKVMRGMMNPTGIMDGLTIYYNFIRPHMTLKTTPARMAGIRLPITDGWADLIRWSTYHNTLTS